MRKPVVKGIIFLAILLLLASVMACSSSTPTSENKPAANSTSTTTPPLAPAKDEIKPTQANINATKDWLAYENTALNLKIKYPKDWMKLEESGIVVGFTSPSKAVFNVIYEDMSKTPSLKVDDVVKATIMEMEEGNENFKLVENTPLTLGNVKSQKIVFTSLVEGKEMKCMQIISIFNNKTLVLTYASTASDYHNHLGTVETMIESLSL